MYINRTHILVSLYVIYFYCLKTTLSAVKVLGHLKECFLAISQLKFNAFSHFSEVSLQIIYQFW